MQALTSFDGVFAAKQGSSSNTNVLALSSASTTAVSGSHTIVVTSLATTSTEYSDKIPSASDTLDGSITLNGHQITLDSTNNTLTSLAKAINLGSYGVSASVVNDSTGARLSLVSKTSGAAGQITFSSSLTDTTNSNTAVGFTSGQPAADAQLSVDGLPTTSASNTVSGVIPGVTFQLLASSPGNPVQVQISNDNSSIESAVQSFVTAYNAVVADLATQEGKDSSGNAQPLYGDPTLALIQTQLSSGLLAGATTGSIKSLSQLGVTLGQDGTLSFSSSTLDDALNTNFSDVLGFLQNSDSFGQSFTKTLNQLGTNSVYGAVSLAKSQNATLEASLNDNITQQDARIALDKTNLTNELNAANEILQGIPTTLSGLNQIYNAITGYKGG